MVASVEPVLPFYLVLMTEVVSSATVSVCSNRYIELDAKYTKHLVKQNLTCVVCLAFIGEQVALESFGPNIVTRRSKKRTSCQ